MRLTCLPFTIATQAMPSHCQPAPVDASFGVRAVAIGLEPLRDRVEGAPRFRRL